MDTQDKSRVFLNYLKGLAIFLMLWGHCVQCCATDSLDFFENKVFKFIYSFHMPLFMIISGYLFFFSFKKRELKELLARRLQPLLQTIFSIAILSFLIINCLLDAVLRKQYLTIFGGGWLYQLGSLWFLWAVIASSVGVGFICKRVQNIFLQIVLLFFWGIVVYLFPQGDVLLFVYPYFVIGFYYAKYKDKIGKKIVLIVKIISSILFFVMLIFFKKSYYIYLSGIFKIEQGLLKSIWIDFYRWALGLFGCVFVISVMQFIFNLITSKNKNYLLLGLDKLGTKTMQIYSLSTIFLSYYLPRFYEEALKVFFNGNNIFASNIIIYNFVFTFILAVIYSVILYFLTRFLEKLKVSKIMFGK